jgi:DNA-binding NarL/FixJ family response regulator
MKIIRTRTIDTLDKKILSGIKNGLSQKEISRECNVNQTLVACRVYKMRKYYECSNTTELILKLINEGLL